MTQPDAVLRPDATSPAATAEASVAPGRRRRYRLAAAGLATLAALGGGSAWFFGGPSERAERVDGLPRRLVSRADLSTVISAAGRVESSLQKTIECEIERLDIWVDGQSFSTNGGVQVLEIVDEGTTVAKGDLLCRLDASAYEELVRIQQIKTQQADAAWQQSRLSLQVAELALREYQDGLTRQYVEAMEGQIAFAEAGLERNQDRLRWTRKMLAKEYAPLSQRALAERSLAQSEHDLAYSRAELSNYLEFGGPKQVKVLRSEVEKRKAEEIANSRRVTRLNERLTHYRKMVDFCTIRAPQDGFVIYGNDPYKRNADRLQPGVQVRQHQPLFYLPDLTRIEVVTYLHESIARRVRPGMLARAKIEGLPGRVLDGRVDSIGPLPVESPSWTIDEDVKYFVAVVKLDRVPGGILPGMSAEVEVDVEHTPNVLAVPTEAIAVERGQDICYVAGVDGLYRRPVSLGKSSRDLLEVTGGLKEGESVVINPTKVEAIDSLVVAGPDVPIDRESAQPVADSAPDPAGTTPTVE